MVTELRPCHHISKLVMICYNRGMKETFFLFGAFAAGWLVAQASKLITALVKNRGKMTFSEFLYYAFKSGGMPSGHTASFMALTTAILMFYGFTPVFVLSSCTTIIFVYDAVNVRYAVGEQGRLLNEIAISDKNPRTKPMKIVEGHTIPQVIVGAIIGIALGILAFLIYKG